MRSVESKALAGSLKAPFPSVGAPFADALWLTTPDALVKVTRRLLPFADGSAASPVRVPVKVMFMFCIKALQAAPAGLASNRTSMWMPWI
ncbi:MAG TPA: hypothetical protein VFY45_07495 [Baekduia sp.]|nr:hypothetical protein [Baekduia sp.]